MSETEFSVFFYYSLAGFTIGYFVNGIVNGAEFPIWLVVLSIILVLVLLTLGKNQVISYGSDQAKKAAKIVSARDE